MTTTRADAENRAASLMAMNAIEAEKRARENPGDDDWKDIAASTEKANREAAQALGLEDLYIERLSQYRLHFFGTDPNHATSTGNEDQQ